MVSAGRRRGILGSSGDRKSTRLNSSHLVISYAVFCLKKKKIHYDAFIYTHVRRGAGTALKIDVRPVCRQCRILKSIILVSNLTEYPYDLVTASNSQHY